MKILLSLATIILVKSVRFALELYTNRDRLPTYWKTALGILFARSLRKLSYWTGIYIGLALATLFYFSRQLKTRLFNGNL